MQKVNTVALIIGLIMFAVPSYAASGRESSGQMQPSNEELTQILDQKLLQYDQRRRTLKGYNSNFSLNYNKNYGKLSQQSGVRSPMIEQQSRLNDFKSFNQGPRGNENFYGFSMKIPLEPKKK